MDNRKLLNSELGRLTPEEFRRAGKSGIAVVLDNVRSAHNVGSAFRSSDAFLADSVVLCGICAQPPSPEIHKSALGAEDTVAWRHFTDTAEAVAALRSEGYVIVSVEQAEHSVSLESFRPEPGRRYALVFGNEVKGVRQDVVDMSDIVLEIPQFGTKHSLNVSVAVGVVLWDVFSKRSVG